MSLATKSRVVAVPPVGTSSMQLITSAFALASAVAPYSSDLLAAGCKPTCLDDVRGAAGDLMNVVATKGSHRRQGVGATAAIERHVREARRVVSLVDSFVIATLPDGDPLVAEWENVVKAARAALRSTGTSGTAVPVPVTTTVPTTAPATVPVTTTTVTPISEAPSVSASSSAPAAAPQVQEVKAAA